MNGQHEVIHAQHQRSSTSDVSQRVKRSPSGARLKYQPRHGQRVSEAGQQPIYEDDEDRQTHLGILCAVVERYRWLCYAYCLMGNHDYLVIETSEVNLSKGMRHPNGVYTQAWNRRHRKVGHLFQARYEATLIDKDSYWLK